MIRTVLFFTFILIMGITGCENSKPGKTDTSLPQPTEGSADAKKEQQITEDSEITDPKAFVPDSMIIFQEIRGDLNQDNREDIVYIIKGTNKQNIVTDEYLGKLDRNRRGLLILLNQTTGYQLAVKNSTCFSSENEDGGVYFPPELQVSIEKGKLYIHYAHGRYGFWRYTFRLQQNKFRLIGYDESENQGPVIHYLRSYNFLTGKKQTRENIHFYSETPDDEVFQETWEELQNNVPVYLTAIRDFDELHFN